ncbi:Disease resistance protein RGA2 [Ananas comosus]|uniref:Disease resistance protein RGA2 n=1 Tax=Ananas comosus TaxID=4615 RepID=A0A199UNJ7_ANACO|nr:Disease resistance protein RGA2 [Ananas comosus]
MQDEIQRLRQAFPRIRAILTFVEEGQTVTTKQNEGLDAWLWQLRDAVDQAEDVLDEMEYYELEKAVQAGDNKVRQGTELNLKWKFTEFADNIFGNDDTLKRLREAVKALDHVAAGSEPLLQLVTQLYNSDVKRQQEDEIRNARETSSFLTEDTICGRDTEKERIVEWLTKLASDEPENIASATVGEVSAFAIVGMGGLGKTTLAQFIYHDEKVRRCFDLVLWVCVSDQFDVAMLTRKIWEAAKVRDSLGDKSLNTIQEILKEKLISKKFLLVLDDVWADNKILQWKNLGNVWELKMMVLEIFPKQSATYMSTGYLSTRHLPEKFFQKLPSLEDLSIEICPNLTTHGILDDGLPETLGRLTLVSSGDLDLPLLESLPKSNNLHFLMIGGCASMTFLLPTAEVFPRLSELRIWNCKELSSLDGLQALLPLKTLRIAGCDKLVELSLLQPPLGLTNTSPTDLVLRDLDIDRPALLRVEPLRNLNNSVGSLSISDGTELTSLDEQWLLQNRNSLQRLVIEKASSLESLPPSMIDLQSLHDLEIHDARLLRSIPELPASMKNLKINGCRPELKEYIEGSGKFANIPSVEVIEKSS